MRDWTKTLPNASFRGVPFHVEEEQLNDAGREIAVHPFVKSEDHDTEDMRRKIRKFAFEAYIVGDAADSDAVAFIEACSQNGAGTLVMPVFGTHNVRCTNCSAVAVKNELGKVRFRLEFVEAGNRSAFVSIALGDRIASNLMDSMASIVSTAISAFAG